MTAVDDAVSGDDGPVAARPGGAPHRPGSPEALREQIDALRERGRELYALDGQVDRRSLRQLVRDENIRVYPIAALLLLTLADLVHGSAFGVVAPDIARTFGISPLIFTAFASVASAVAFVVPLLIAKLVGVRPRRAVVMLWATGLSATVTVLAGLVPGVALYLLIQLVDTTTTTASTGVSYPLQLDLVPPRARVRIMSLVWAVGTAAAVVVPLVIVGLTSEPLGLNWRGVMLVMGALAVLAVLGALGLRDPGVGRSDSGKLEELVLGRQADGVQAPPAGLRGEVPDAARQDGGNHVDPPTATLLESARVLLTIPSSRLFLAATLVSTMSAPLDIYLAFYRADAFGLDLRERALLDAVGGVVALVALLVLSPIGDRLLQGDSARFFRVTALLAVVGTLLNAGQVLAPNVAVLVLLTVAGTAAFSFQGPALAVGSMTIIPAAMRPLVGSVYAGAALIGTTLGTVTLGGLVVTMGVTKAVLLSCVPALAGTYLVFRAGRFYRSDITTTIDITIEESVLAGNQASGVRPPLLTCRGIDLHYGHVQVLRDVDFTLNEGEIVALLGVNGAGKSSLLKVISGLVPPTRGLVRLDGHDITLLEANRRTGLGFATVVGGMSTFPSLTVEENLRAFAHAARERGERAGRAEARRIDQALQMFPRLADRRHQQANLLSGGERQMLGLARAVVNPPRLMMIDELSLGLAPVVVEQLLEVVSDIRERGTSVVIVDQSAELMLELADRACFMERGQLRFEGACEDLARRDDLLRAVFLPGRRED